MVPSFDEIQEGINQLIDLVLGVSKGVVWQLEYTQDPSENKGRPLSLCTPSKTG